MDNLFNEDITNEYAKASSCILQITQREPYLSGKGVIIAIIDSGIDFYLPEFLDSNGNTRILSIWDQTDNPRLYTQEQINEAIRLGRIEGSRIVPAEDISGHGTAVAAIAAGTISGVAPQAEILVIKLGSSGRNSFPLTTQLMRGINFAVNTGIERNMPVAVNISYGNTYGDHQGNSLLERFIDNASEIGRTSIVIGSGNEGISRGHISGTLNRRTELEMAVSDFETGLSIQLWKYYQDKYRITIVSPNGEMLDFDTFGSREAQIIKRRLENTDLMCFIGVPLPYNINQEIFIDMIPDLYIASGIWKIIIEPVDIVTGEYNIYLPGYAVRNAGTGFLNATPDTTITIPSTSNKAITVGAYNVNMQSYADFSGRGFVYRNVINKASEQIQGIVQVKPEISAPGVDISVPVVGGGYERVSGTSFATPFVTGVSALLMEWGIIRENDRYMYGEKLKAFLIDSAQPILGEAQYPNDKTGWGRLCVNSDSL